MDPNRDAVKGDALRNFAAPGGWCGRAADPGGGVRPAETRRAPRTACRNRAGRGMLGLKAGRNPQMTTLPLIRRGLGMRPGAPHVQALHAGLAADPAVPVRESGA